MAVRLDVLMNTTSLCSAHSLEMQPVGIEWVGALNVWTFACP